MKALVGAFNQEKALVGAFSVIVKTGCGTDGPFYSTNSGVPAWPLDNTEHTRTRGQREERTEQQTPGPREKVRAAPTPSSPPAVAGLKLTRENLQVNSK